MKQHGFDSEDKLAVAKRKMSVWCKCGRRICFPYTSKFELKYRICSWCGRKVLNPRIAFKETLKEKLKEVG